MSVGASSTLFQASTFSLGIRALTWRALKLALWLAEVYSSPNSEGIIKVMRVAEAY